MGFGFFKRKKEDEEPEKPVERTEYVPDHSLNYSEFSGEMESIGLAEIEAARNDGIKRSIDSLSESNMHEITDSDLDVKLNPEKYMEEELKSIEDEEKKLIEEEERKYGKPLDISEWEKREQEHAQRKATKIEACRAKWGLS